MTKTTDSRTDWWTHFIQYKHVVTTVINIASVQNDLYHFMMYSLSFFFRFVNSLLVFQSWSRKHNRRLISPRVRWSEGVLLLSESAGPDTTTLPLVPHSLPSPHWNRAKSITLAFCCRRNWATVRLESQSSVWGRSLVSDWPVGRSSILPSATGASPTTCCANFLPRISAPSDSPWNTTRAPYFPMATPIRGETAPPWTYEPILQSEGTLRHTARLTDMFSPSRPARKTRENNENGEHKYKGSYYCKPNNNK